AEVLRDICEEAQAEEPLVGARQRTEVVRGQVLEHATRVRFMTEVGVEPSQHAAEHRSRRILLGRAREDLHQALDLASLPVERELVDAVGQEGVGALSLLAERESFRYQV